jgi:hypothetical protein
MFACHNCVMVLAVSVRILSTGIVTNGKKNGNIATISCIGNLPGTFGDRSHPYFFSGSCAIVVSASDVARLGPPFF